CVRLREIRKEMSDFRRTSDRPHVEENFVQKSESQLILQVSNLTKRFTSGGRTVSALDSVAIEIEVGESVGLVGESGSGKTTLARCLVGLETPTAGQIWIDGIDASNYGSASKSDQRTLRRTIQMIFQDPYSSLNPVKTVRATLKEAVVTHDPLTRKPEN